MAATKFTGDTVPLIERDGSGGHTPYMVASLEVTDVTGVEAPTADLDTGAGTQTGSMFAIALPASGGAVPASDTNPVPTKLLNGVSKTQAVTVTAGAYAAGNVVGGIVSVTTANASTGRPVLLKSVQINDKSGSAPPLSIYFFKATPSGGTYTDNGALAWAAADNILKVGLVKVTALNYDVLDGQASVNVSGLDALLAVNATTLFMLIVANGTFSFTDTDDLSITLGLEMK